MRGPLGKYCFDISQTGNDTIKTEAAQPVTTGWRETTSRLFASSQLWYGGFNESGP
jgi:hypothetical protein